MTQYSRPIADLSTGAWTTTPLWSKLNEDPYNDSTEIVLNNQTANMCDIDLGTVTDPVSSVNHILRIRAHKTGSGSITCTAVLKCGATTIRSNALTLGTGYAETTITLTGAEADAINDYGGLHVTLTGTCAAATRYIYVSWIVFEVPDVNQTVEESFTAAKKDYLTASDQANVQDTSALTRKHGLSPTANITVEETLYGA